MTHKGTSTVHKLKIEPKWFANVSVGLKTCEIRKNDRDFRVNDFILLQEWDDGYSGNECLVRITHILHDWEFIGVKQGYVILSITII